MRLKQIQKILKQIDFEKCRLEGTFNKLKNHYTFTNINGFKRLLLELSSLEIYQKEINALNKSEIYLTSNDSLIVEQRAYHHILSLSRYLINSAEPLLRVFENFLPPSDESSVSIKLPDPSDFEALVKSMSILHKVTSQVVINDIIKGHVKISNWEFGSFWIELILGSQAAVALIASISWSAAVITKKYKESEILEKQIRSLEIKNESLEDILESQKKLTNKLIEQETSAVVVQHFGKDMETEYSERLKYAIKMFAELIQQGAEIHPALNAPETVQNLFPDFKKIGTIATRIKQIEEKLE
jgi:hypothetical protein